jgi:hypothetical protein
MDGLQLPLPAGWALKRPVGDPLEWLLEMPKEIATAKADIRAIVERLAERHGASPRDVEAAMTGYVDDMLADLLYETERDIMRDIDTGVK